MKTDYNARAREMVPCPNCGASIGELCIGSSGYWVKTTHWVRRRDAGKLARERRRAARKAAG